MKMTLAALLFLSGINSYASNEAPNMGTIRCEQNRVFSPDVRQGVHHVLLEQQTRYGYKFTLFITKNASSRVLFTSQVKAYGEDVLLNFTNKRDDLNFGIYLDEMDQSYLHLGRAKMNFDCTPEHSDR